MNTSSLVQKAWSFCHTLRAAFAGQLVPQDPNDEPASVLIERIGAALSFCGQRRKVCTAGSKARGCSMSRPSFVAYIDEAGCEGFKFLPNEQGSSRWFVLSALVVRKQNDLQLVQVARQARELLRKEPNDEPASVLLERIHAERDARQGPRAPGSRRSKGRAST